jgi:hypothetical protein
MLHIIEAVQQLRHEAGRRQVFPATIALVSSLGSAFASSATALLGSATMLQ